jgi:hypothetical protein
VEQTGDGLVWVAVSVADREWWRGLGPLREGEGGSWYDVDRIQRFYDTVIEVLDPRPDRLVAVTRVDAALTALIGGAYAVALEQNEAGEYALQVSGRTLRR